MNSAVRYLGKQKDFFPSLSVLPDRNLNYIVIIPCYNETGILGLIESLHISKRPRKSIEIIVVINDSTDSPNAVITQNEKTERELRGWSKKNNENDFSIRTIYKSGLDPRYAGVGLARKIGMDEAAFRFSQISNLHGIIISLDADCMVDKDYFTEIEKLFMSNSFVNGCNIYFEHPVQSTGCNSNIILYEMYLRYFVEALRFIKFPYAAHTVGSCFAVRTETYCKEGGMNRKKAGEDFYFLQKIFRVGHFFELNSTTVFPSCRLSDRVPFGTGPMMKNMSEIPGTLLVYDFQSFILLMSFFSLIPGFYERRIERIREEIDHLPGFFSEYLYHTNFFDRINEIKKNASSAEMFMKRFFHHYPNFFVIKTLNYLHQKDFFQKKPVQEMVKCFLAKTGKQTCFNNNMDILQYLRCLQKNRGNIPILQQ